ncbi:TetR/AcrR family transcriptional regulator [Ruania zhangjianzhongii]|uniref:TetR/AcrR family transcriptional regulator n=1 Tax=Ruania zhangjianzhongii TaxID=2603206 RepID=UPI00143DD919|nr:TetR/AcrR family transcriptional regulator [Ruania zhangjianzhongii]
MSEKLGAWERRKLTAMRHIQRVALDLFDAEGYEKVTVEQIAAEAGVSPSSIYRYFGVKERVVLWDEHDRGLMAGIAAGLQRGPALEAIENQLRQVAAGVDALAEDEREFLRHRISYIRHEPQILAVMHQQADAMEGALRSVLESGSHHGADPLELRIVAGMVASTVLNVLVAWAEREDRPGLSPLFEQAFRILRRGIAAEESS